MTRKRATGGPLKQKVRTAKKRSTASARWLERQLNDPYVHKAQELGYRSRAAFKLLELDAQFHILKAGQRVLDLGAAPGGWTQVAVAKVGSDKGRGMVLGLDILPIDNIAGATLIQQDFMHDDAPDILLKLCGGKMDVVLSDMAPNTIGHTSTDHLRIMAMADAIYDFARQVLAPNGSFVLKLWQGGAQQTLLNLVKKDFSKVRHAKPPASRSDSAETFLVATGFRGKI